ncbi:MAG: twin-arginine translocase TatA/TatE family subunit [Dehalococcoidales bacterium]|nr:twin-arginine translocase TatA/TatE family subunit [Dehalococcoidales bacterium]
MDFLGISMWEFLLILVVIVIVLGPARIPGIARNIGNVMRTIRKASSDLTMNLTKEIELEDTTKPPRETEPDKKAPLTESLPRKNTAAKPDKESRKPEDPPHHHE